MTTRGVTTTSLIILLTLCGLRVAVAEPTTPVASGTQCTLRGTTQLPIDAAIHDANGKVIARFSGSNSALQVVEFPSDAQGRAKIATGTGTGSFRIQGMLDAAKIPLYASANLPVVAGHVWLTAGRSVTFATTGSNRIKVQKKLTTPFLQTFSTWTPCSMLSLNPSAEGGWSPPGDARGYVLKKETLDVYGEPTAGVSTVVTLNRSPQLENVLFFSTEQRGTWVHIEHHSDVVVRGWARASDLTPLPRGVTMDQLAPASALRSAPRLTVQGQPRSIKTRNEVPLRLSAKHSDPVVGVIENNTETLVIDVVAGWASVLPASLHVMPPKDGQFWVKSAELGLDGGKGS
jgi:hypothetical protein